MTVFRRLLVNTLVTGVTSSFLWFALTFWVYLETRSVVATGVIGGAFSHLLRASSAPSSAPSSTATASTRRWCWPTTISAACFALATVVFVAVDADDLLRLRSPWFWLLVGAHAARLGRRPDARHRPVDLRDAARARGPAGPGQRHGRHGHRRLVRHHLGVQRPRHRPARHGLGLLRSLSRSPSARSSTCGRSTSTSPSPSPTGRATPTGHVDVRGALEAIRAVPGLMMLILLAAFNNLLGGVFMALMDAYGLSLVSVETWGLLWGFISLAFIAGGLFVARRGLGPQPAAGRARRQPRQLDWCARCSPLRSSIVHADHRHGRLAGADPGHRGRRADRAAAVDPLRAPGPGVRLRPARRERGRRRSPRSSSPRSPRRCSCRS